MSKKKNVLKIIRVIAFILICILTLTAQECDMRWLSELPGAIFATALVFLGVDDQRAQEIGAGLFAGGLLLDQILSTTINYDPGISQRWIDAGLTTHNALIENRNANQLRQQEMQAREERRVAENERHRQEMIARFEEFERTMPTGTSSITTHAGEQNVGNPHINPIIRPGEGRSVGAGGQRVGGGVTNQRPLTRRNDPSANPQLNPGQPPVPVDVARTAVAPAPVEAARTAVIPAETAERIASTLDENPPNRQPPTVTPPPPSPRPAPHTVQPQPVPSPPPVEGRMYRGIDWADPNARIPAGTGIFTVRDATILRRWGEIFHIPTESEKDNIIRLAQALQRVLNSYGSQLTITSWIRPTSVNSGRLDSSGRIVPYRNTQFFRFNYNRDVVGSSAVPHTIGIAADFSDPTGAFAAFLAQNQRLLADNGLWMQDEEQTLPRRYVHLDLHEGRNGMGGERFRTFRARVN